VRAEGKRELRTPSSGVLLEHRGCRSRVVVVAIHGERVCCPRSHEAVEVRHGVGEAAECDVEQPPLQARLQRVEDPAAHEVRSWSAYERITVSRAADEEGMKGKMRDT